MLISYFFLCLFAFTYRETLCALEKFFKSEKKEEEELKLLKEKKIGEFFFIVYINMQINVKIFKFQIENKNLNIYV